MKEKNPLAKAFLEDHKHLIQGFSRLLGALEEGDVTEASQIADDIDRLAGPHIEFEEEFFYPILEQVRGREYVSQLYKEHGAGLHAVKSLLGAKSDLGSDETEALVSEAQTALDHAVSCGGLLGHVTALDEEQQVELLQKLLGLREQGRRWTELAEKA
jgi:Hemerythrin HHE cation binding domain